MNKIYLKIIMVLYFFIGFSINFNLTAKAGDTVNGTISLTMSNIMPTNSIGSIGRKKCEKILHTLIGKTASVSYVYNYSANIGEAVVTFANLLNGKIILHPEGTKAFSIFMNHIKNEKTLIVDNYKLYNINFEIPNQLTMRFKPIVTTGNGSKDWYCDLSSSL